MLNLNKLLSFEFEKEHDFEHDFLLKKNYSTPKIFNANGDLKKRWYIQLSPHL